MLNKIKNLEQHHLLATMLTVVAIIFASAPLFVSQTVNADSGAQLSISPSSMSITPNSNLTLSININTNGDSVNTVQSYLTYNASNFSFVSTDPGSSFNAAFPNTEKNGVVEFSAGTSGSYNGSTTVATIVLRANANTSSSAINLADVCSQGDYTSTNCSAAYDSASSGNDLTSVSGGTYEVTSSTPAATNSTSQTTKSKSVSSNQAPSSSSNNQPKTVADSTIDISNVKVINITGNSASISWTTSVPSTSYVNFGLSSRLGLTESNSTLTTDHLVNIGSNYLTQGNTYFYQVSSTDANGQTSTSTTQQFSTNGFSITLIIKDTNGHVLSNSKVQLGSQQAVTNKDGTVTFTNIPAGLQTVTIIADHKTTKKDITVGNYKPGTSQYENQTFTLTALKGTNYMPYYLVALLALILAAGIIILSENNWFHNLHSPQLVSRMNNPAPSYPINPADKQSVIPIKPISETPVAQPIKETIQIVPTSTKQAAVNAPSVPLATSSTSVPTSTTTPLEEPISQPIKDNLEKPQEEPKEKPITVHEHESPEAGTIFKPTINRTPQKTTINPNSDKKL